MTLPSKGPHVFGQFSGAGDTHRAQVRLCSPALPGDVINPPWAMDTLDSLPPGLSQGFWGDSLAVLTPGSEGRALLTGAAQQCHVLGTGAAP